MELPAILDANQFILAQVLGLNRLFGDSFKITRGLYITRLSLHLLQHWLKQGLLIYVATIFLLLKPTSNLIVNVLHNNYAMSLASYMCNTVGAMVDYFWKGRHPAETFVGVWCRRGRLYNRLSRHDLCLLLLFENWALLSHINGTN
jgi:hypothetical protein